MVVDTDSRSDDPQRHAAPIGQQAPLGALLASVRRVGAGFLPSQRCLGQRSVQEDSVYKGIVHFD